MFSLPHFSKTMKNSCRLTLLTDSFGQLDQKQSVDSFVLLFEVHITFRFQSEVPPLFIFRAGENKGITNASFHCFEPVSYSALLQ